MALVLCKKNNTSSFHDKRSSSAWTKVDSNEKESKFAGDSEALLRSGFIMEVEICTPVYLQNAGNWTSKICFQNVDASINVLLLPVEQIDNYAESLQQIIT